MKGEYTVYGSFENIGEPPLLSGMAPYQPGGRPMKRKRTTTTKKVNKKPATTKRSLLEQQLAMINPNAAGIDVASKEMWVLCARGSS